MSSFKELIAVVYNPRQEGEIIKVCNLWEAAEKVK